MKVYISGKINGLPPFYSQMRFANAERKLAEKGFEVVNPWKLDMSDCKEWDDFMMRDLEILRHCDAIYMLCNWQESDGALVEYDFAKGKKMQILYEPSCLHCKHYDRDSNHCNLLGFKDLGGFDSCEKFERYQNATE